ncbi:branched-chain amino acid aminotransferase [Streptomyces sp. ICN988]|uniref:branched-chain amino acid aminotransferase n=1 Tax=unclassified Streptomyces TaxID=2593676 RepID=UPI0021E3FCC3|nr:branched-chain amino acid aminotransferase [Streptomyces sp. ICN988]MCV2460093.1 branched-chain amino acid aminotransferase [Streptomyces sp. ICN988]
MRPFDAKTAEPDRIPFGEQFTPHMVTAEWTERDGWSTPCLSPFGDLSMSPAMVGLHYGQVVFEGLKAYRRGGDSVACFRPADHAARLRRSAERLAIPALPEESLLAAVDLLLEADGGCLPERPGLSLYLRPVLYASEANLALRPARRYAFLLIAFVTGGFFSDRPDPVRVWVGRDYTRAAPGGTGAVKFAGNYAPSYAAQEQARRAGCDQVVWLDPVERRWIDELGGMNLFFVRGAGPSAELVTPPVTGTLLPGVTRDSLLHLAGARGLAVREEPLSVERWKAECLDGTITETFASGTAAVVTPVGSVLDGTESWQVGTGLAGSVTLALRDALVDIHTGRAPAPEGWLRTVGIRDAGRGTPARRENLVGSGQ